MTGTALPNTMHAVQLTRHGDTDALVYRDDLPVPHPAPGEVLLRVGAAGVNNVDINTRVGWYSRAVTGSTDSTGASGNEGPDVDTNWDDSPVRLPLIQGIDVCGHVVAHGEGVAAPAIGCRVLVEPCLRRAGAPLAEARFLGSDVDGGFAQYCAVPAASVHPVACDWSDAELATMPCSWSTAENLLTRAAVTAGEWVLVTGASGGVGSAAVQLAKRRGAEVIAIAAPDKADAVTAVGAGRVLSRDADLLTALGSESCDVVVDVVGGPQWPLLLEVLRRGGRYAVSGAIAGPMVDLDLRTLYLKDLTLIGGTVLDSGTFAQLVGYIERGEIRPLLAATYPLSAIAEAQADFLAKQHTGKLVLIPPQ